MGEDVGAKRSGFKRRNCTWWGRGGEQKDEKRAKTKRKRWGKLEIQEDAGGK